MEITSTTHLINIKSQDMASKAPSPLIRSSNAFSVQIPEGSNSAKARQSDCIAQQVAKKLVAKNQTAKRPHPSISALTLCLVIWDSATFKQLY
jgi:hypothetical protein